MTAFCSERSNFSTKFQCVDVHIYIYIYIFKTALKFIQFSYIILFIIFLLKKIQLSYIISYIIFLFKKFNPLILFYL